MAEPIAFNEKQNSIALPNAKIEDESPGIVTGWGLQSAYASGAPDELQKLETAVAPAPTCQGSHQIQLYEDQLCTKQRVGMGTCMVNWFVVDILIDIFEKINFFRIHKYNTIVISFLICRETVVAHWL